VKSVKKQTQTFYVNIRKTSTSMISVMCYMLQFGKHVLRTGDVGLRMSDTCVILILTFIHAVHF